MVDPLDPRMVELRLEHSREENNALTVFYSEHPELSPYDIDRPLTDEERELVGKTMDPIWERHQKEAADLAAKIEAEEQSG